jgi:hypothetical protein
MNPWPLDNSVLLLDNAAIHHCMDMEEVLNEIGTSFSPQVSYFSLAVLVVWSYFFHPTRRISIQSS